MEIYNQKRQSGKSTRIANLLKSDKNYVVVVHNHNVAKNFVKTHNVDSSQVIPIETVRADLRGRRDVKILVDEVGACLENIICAKCEYGTHTNKSDFKMSNLKEGEEMCDINGNQDGVFTTIKMYGDNLYFDEPSHTYTYTFPDNTVKEMTSGTTLLKPYFPFDVEGVTQKLSDSTHPVYGGLSTDEIKQLWQEKAQFGTDVHKFCEDYLNGEFVTIENDRMVQAHAWLRKQNFDKAIPEVKIVAPEWGISGTVDLLVKKNGKWYMYDFKTDKAIRKKSYDGEKAVGVLSHLDNCNYNKFTFQLGLYKLILDVFYDIQVESCHIIHFSDYKTTEYVLPYPVEYIGLLVQKHIDSGASDGAN